MASRQGCLPFSTPSHIRPAPVLLLSEAASTQDGVCRCPFTVPPATGPSTDGVSGHGVPFRERMHHHHGVRPRGACTHRRDLVKTAPEVGHHGAVDPDMVMRTMLQSTVGGMHPHTPARHHVLTFQV
jgi:hypothetical protein